MHRLSLVLLYFHATSVNAAAFYPMYYPQAPNLGPQSLDVWVTSMNSSHSWNLPHQDTTLPRWLPRSAIVRPGQRQTPNHVIKRSPSSAGLDTRPTPAPTGDPSPSTTVYITDEYDFALVAPEKSYMLISDAEANGRSFCTVGASSAACSHRFRDGFITAAAVTRSDDGSWIQVTGCIDISKFPMSAEDGGGQFDVRYPNGAQCSFGGYGASFIEQIEPSANRFCLRCCASEHDQINCNSHQDRAGCLTAVPGVYNFPDRGVSCG